jgi:hypothetical protein
MRFWVAVIDCFRELRDDRYIGNSQLELHFADRPTEDELLREARAQFPNRVYNVRTLIERCPELEDPFKLTSLDVDLEWVEQQLRTQMQAAHTFPTLQPQKPLIQLENGERR